MTIPDQKSPEVNCKSLQKYYDSLQSTLNNYAVMGAIVMESST